MSEIELEPDAPAGGLEPDAPPPRRNDAARRRSASTNRLMRWLHVYTSMFSLLVVLFFGITGITLNHPSWTLGDDPDRSTHSGTLPIDYLEDDGGVDFLAVSEYVRDEFGVAGDVADYGVTGNDATIAYKGPGYAADITFAVDDGSFSLLVEEQGFVGVMNDLHKGRDTSTLWKWVIDLSAAFLVAVAVTGLGIQLFQRKRRTRALLFAAGGTVASIVLIWVTMV